MFQSPGASETFLGNWLLSPHWSQKNSVSFVSLSFVYTEPPQCSLCQTSFAQSSRGFGHSSTIFPWQGVVFWADASCLAYICTSDRTYPFIRPGRRRHNPTSVWSCSREENWALWYNDVDIVFWLQDFFCGPELLLLPYYKRKVRMYWVGIGTF